MSRSANEQIAAEHQETISETVPVVQSSYLKSLHAAVRDHFAGAVSLKAFLAAAQELTVADKLLIVEQALLLIEQNYAHLPLKRAMHAINPVQRLRLLQRNLEQASADKIMPDTEFHREMTDIFTSVRDLHTNYLLPAPYNAMSAFLPFMVEDYYEGEQRRYLVSRVAPGFVHESFKPGVELLYWNGMPVERAVWNNAQRYAGSNLHARHARGVHTLTTRALVIAPPPDEEWVIVQFRNLQDQIEDIRFDWMVNPPPASSHGGDPAAPAAYAALGLDLEQDTVQRIRKALFSPHVVAAEKRAREKVEHGDNFTDLETALPHIFQARAVETPSGVFGYIRIRSFNHWPPAEFVNEFIRLISAVPQNGLIIDVRANGGGVIMNGELILQTLTPGRIEPEPVQFINTPLNLRICQRHGRDSNWTDLSRWVDSMRQALQTGSTFSAGFPISDPDECNAIGQKYFGPSVLIIDALGYSTTDIFTAGFQDHEIGPVLATDGNTGAGGANVWTHQHFVEFVMAGDDSEYKPLPGGAGMRVSVRRTLRVGKHAGAPVEDLGVVPDERHYMTRDDLLETNADLINRAASLLEDRPVTALKVTVRSGAGAETTVIAQTSGITRLDFYVDERPVRSVDVSDSRTEIAIPKSAAAAIAEIRGFNGTSLVARYRTTL